MWTAVVFFVVLLVTYLWVTRPKRPPNFPPGPPTFLIFGNVIDLVRTASNDFQKHLNRLRSEHKSDIIGMVDPFGQPLVYVFGGELVKEAGNITELTGRPELFTVMYLSEMKRAGIFFNEGPLWQEQRRFALKHLRDLGMGKSVLNTMIADEYALFAEHLKKVVGQEVKANNLFITVVLNIIWKMVASRRFDYDDPERQRLQDIVTEFTQITGPQNILFLFPSARFVAPESSGFNKIKVYHSAMQGLFGPCIAEHRATLDPSHPRDFIDAFLIESQRPDAEKRGFDENNLRTLCLDFFIAGSETTSLSMTWALLLMVLYPDVQAKVQAELDEVVGEGRLPSYEDRPRLPYTEAVMTEIWRYTSFVPLAVPHRSSVGPAQLGGYTLPKDTTVMIHLQSAHHDRGHWGDPDVFRPERFIGEDGKFRKDDYFVPFGLGKRACLGESMARTEFFTFLSCMLHQFHVRLPKGAKKPSTEVRQFAIFLQPDDFNVILDHRVRA
ncbi:methyl farnesoate epoxidase-like [Amphibalanus amphitrite]|nr:methyl farnesoate epoxidase-like [Amphibalanus amphitrite]